VLVSSVMLSFDLKLRQALLSALLILFLVQTVRLRPYKIVYFNTLEEVVIIDALLISLFGTDETTTFTTVLISCIIALMTVVFFHRFWMIVQARLTGNNNNATIADAEEQGRSQKVDDEGVMMATVVQKTAHDDNGTGSTTKKEADSYIAASPLSQQRLPFNKIDSAQTSSPQTLASPRDEECDSSEESYPPVHIEEVAIHHF
jgi:hypothetical protein